MERNGSVQISHEQWTAAYWGLGLANGDPEVMEDLGIPVTEETLLRHVEAGAEVAELLGIDTRSAAEVARDEARAYYEEEFFLTGPMDLDDDQRARNAAGVAHARALLEQRRAS